MFAAAVLPARCFSYSINSASDRRDTVTPSLLTDAGFSASAASWSAGSLIPTSCGMVHRLNRCRLLYVAATQHFDPHRVQRHPPIFNEQASHTGNHRPIVTREISKWRIWFVALRSAGTFDLQCLQNRPVFSTLIVSPHSHGSLNRPRSLTLITLSDVVLIFPQCGQIRSRVTKPAVFIVRQTDGNVVWHSPHFKPPGKRKSSMSTSPR
jgi:hypothetical protein